MRLRYIRRYKLKIPLLGNEVNECLEKLEKTLLQKDPSLKRGQIFFIEGSGGFGKSEILEQLSLMLTGSVALEEGDESIEPLAIPATAPIIFGGIIDLFDYSSYNGRSIERALISNWQAYYKMHLQVKADLINSEPEIIFRNYYVNQGNFQRFRFALPKVQGVEKLLTTRRQNLFRAFISSLETLCRSYTPIICFDTAELLDQEDAPEEQSNVATATIEWLDQLLSNPVSQKCLIIIAGRKTVTGYKDNEEAKNVRISFYQDGKIAASEELYDYLKRKRGDKLQYYPLKRLGETEIKSYIYYWYYHYSSPIQPMLPVTTPVAEKPPLEIIETIDLETLAEDEWGEVAGHLQQINTSLQKATNAQEVYAMIDTLTNGRPLMVDWFCQIIFRQLDYDLLDEQGEVAFSNFKRLLGSIIGAGAKDYFVFDASSPVSPDKYAQVLRYACIARKGLDASTVAFLAEQENQGLFPAEIERILADLKKQPLIKVRTSFRLSLKLNIVKEEAIFLHDEIYDSLRKSLDQELYLFFNVEGMYRVLAAAYSDRQGKFSRSIVFVENMINELRQNKLNINSKRFIVGKEETGTLDTPLHNLTHCMTCKVLRKPKTTTSKDREFNQAARSLNKELDEIYWFNNTNIEKYFELENLIQDLLVERLYYRMQSSVKEGYEEFCIVDTMAIVEQEAGFETRLKKEYLRQELLLGMPLDVPDFKTYRDQECKVRQIKRYLRDRPEATPQILQDLIEIALKNPDDNNRLKLCQADALVSQYDYAPIEKEFEALANLEKAIALGKAVLKKYPYVVPFNAGEVRNYVFWQANIVLGRARVALGKLLQETNRLDKSIIYFRDAVENFKQAGNRAEVYLNDTRTNLAFAYKALGYQSLAIKTSNLALYGQLKLGHKVHIATSLNIKALLLADSQYSIVEAFSISQRALKLFDDVKQSELLEMSVYQQLQFYNAQLARRVGRFYAHLFEDSETLHAHAIRTLKNVLKYYRTIEPQNRLKYLITLNELGCTYRSRGRSRQVRLESFASTGDNKSIRYRKWGKAQQRDFRRALNILQSVEESCQRGELNLSKSWYLRIDNLLDIVHLMIFLHIFQDKYSWEQVNQKVSEIRKEIQQIWEGTASIQSENDFTRAYEPARSFFEGELLSHEANWNWKQYQKLQKANGQNSDKKALLENYIKNQIQALVEFDKFYKSMLISFADGTKEYSRDAYYMLKIDEQVTQFLATDYERAVAIEVVKNMLDEYKETQQTIQPGLLAFCYMLNITEAVNLQHYI